MNASKLTVIVFLGLLSGCVSQSIYNYNKAKNYAAKEENSFLGADGTPIFNNNTTLYLPTSDQEEPTKNTANSNKDTFAVDSKNNVDKSSKATNTVENVKWWNKKDDPKHASSNNFTKPDKKEQENRCIKETDPDIVKLLESPPVDTNALDDKDKEIAKAWNDSYRTLIKSHCIGNNFNGVEGNKYVVVEPEIYVEVEPTIFGKIFLDYDTEEDNEAVMSIKDREQKINFISENKLTKIVEDERNVWSSGKGVSWHLSDEYTGLRSALQSIKGIDSKVTIAHFDTGYNPNEAFLPERFDRVNSWDFTVSPPKKNSGTKNKPNGHGVRTLSTLAGNKAYIDATDNDYDYNDYIGANPLANVVEYRINKWSFIHFNPRDMAEAIDHASLNGVDVISISHGGFPSLKQRNAVNAAYDRGTAIFAATGDFFTAPFFDFNSPTLVVFPARYNRVMGVAGVTAKGNSYADADCKWCIWSPAWYMRGNYGPKEVMKGHVISAFSPNITHSVPSKDNNNQIALDGGGTSHATPQVAGAASIWLQKNKKFLESQGVWCDGKDKTVKNECWKKAEAVYKALIDSSQCTDEPSSPYKLDYSLEKMGEGVLKANKLVNVTYDKIELDRLEKRPDSVIGYKWIIDLFKTTDFIPNASYKDFLINMLLMETEQLVLRSDELAEVFRKLHMCEDEKCHSKQIVECMRLKEVNVKEFLNLISGSDMASPFLKKIASKLESNINKLRDRDYGYSLE